ncbi:hypothetical protein LIER_25261 [Lithospermum erythrorhizon]|uniref:Integrase catalytic domain-containing protein n=1 Tax=Lithospermum erythrorhizon TaxID=34254 RepID=A0AAV3R449_LITER
MPRLHPWLKNSPILCFNTYRVEKKEEADRLSKLSTTYYNELPKGVFKEVRECPAYEAKFVRAVLEKREDWRTAIVKFLSNGQLPRDPGEARKIQHRSLKFCMYQGELYRKSWEGPLLVCVSREDVPKVLNEVHSGWCESHIGGRALATKITRTGFFRPSMIKDSAEFVQKCDACQKLGNVPQQSPHYDDLDPQPDSPRYVGNRFGEDIVQFLWKHVLTCFRIPRILVLDNRTQFASSALREFCEKYDIEQRFAPVYYPQSNGQIEVMNRTIFKGIKKNLAQSGASGGAWIEELSLVLWSLRTTPSHATCETPFSLIYGTEAVVPVEVGLPTLRQRGFDKVHNSQLLREQLTLISELRDRALVTMQKYKRFMASSFNRTGTYESEELDGKPVQQTWHASNLSKYCL